MLVPSATVAEVLRPDTMQTTKGTRDWLLGSMRWRGISVPVVAFERLLGATGALPAPVRLVVMYPPPGADRIAYFAIAANGDPHSVYVGADTPAATLPAGIDPRHVAAAVELRGSVALIPDLASLKPLF